MDIMRSSAARQLVRVVAFGAVSVVCSPLFAQQQGGPPANNPPLFKGERKKADSTERVLTGTVLDKTENPVEGAVVQIKDTKTLRVRSFLTKADGKYQFSGLSVDTDYEVKAERQGLASDVRTLTVYDTRKEPILNLKLDKS
jgi:Carboxypeptidase regulatory-like domain